jgi:hypothetical protein
MFTWVVFVFTIVLLRVEKCEQPVSEKQKEAIFTASLQMKLHCDGRYGASPSRSSADSRLNIRGLDD